MERHCSRYKKSARSFTSVLCLATTLDHRQDTGDTGEASTSLHKLLF